MRTVLAVEQGLNRFIRYPTKGETKVCMELLTLFFLSGGGGSDSNKIAVNKDGKRFEITVKEIQPQHHGTI